MSYSGLTNKQAVSFNNLQDGVNTGVFQLLTSIPSSNEQITKSDASTYVSLDTSYSTYSSKSSNQIIVKQDLKPSFQYSGTLYWYLDCSIVCGWTSSSNACSGYSSAIYYNTAYWNGSLAVGTTIFTTGPLRYAAIGDEYYIINYSGVYYWFTVNNYSVELPLTSGYLYGSVISTLGVCTYNVSWSYTMNALSGSMQISKNGTLIVNVTSTQSGSFSYSPGDYISIALDATCNTSLTALVDLTVTDNTGTLYSNSSTGSPATSLSSGALYPTGPVTITASSDEF